MNVTALSDSELSASVLAVPPVARHADMSPDPTQNRKLIRHIEAGGVRTLLQRVPASKVEIA